MLFVVAVMIAESQAVLVLVCLFVVLGVGRWEGFAVLTLQPWFWGRMSHAGHNGCTLFHRDCTFVLLV